MANRGITRNLFKYGLRTSRLILDGSNGAVETPFHITPQAAPTGTGVAGDSYMGLDGTLYTHNGTAFMSSPSGLMVPKNAVTVLTAADSGKTCVWSTAAGYLYTLPTAVAGLRFKFVVAVNITSVGAKVLTFNASQFILGSFLQIPDTAAQVVAQNANGTTIRSWNGNGSTTGGYAGDFFHLEAISTTQWVINGVGLATGTEATPFAAS